MMLMIVMMTMKMMVIQTPREEVDNEDDGIDANNNLCQLFRNPHPHDASASAFFSREHCSESRDIVGKLLMLHYLTWKSPSQLCLLSG